LHGGHGLSSVTDPGSVEVVEGVVDETIQTAQKVEGLVPGKEAGLSAVEADVKAVVAPDTEEDTHAIDHGADFLVDAGSALTLALGRHLADFRLSLSLKRFATAERNLHVILTCEGWSKGCHPLAISLTPFYNGNLIGITKNNRQVKVFARWAASTSERLLFAKCFC